VSSSDTPSTQYAIRVAGHLSTRWVAWFDGLTLTTEPGGTTVLTGVIADQAALHGVLQKLRDAGVPLVSVTPIEITTDQEAEQ
jgi:hypothetical protein